MSLEEWITFFLYFYEKNVLFFVLFMLLRIHKSDLIDTVQSRHITLFHTKENWYQ